MPKSKRAKVVHLTKVQKHGKELSEKLYAAVREAADTYQYCFVFSVENMRNTYLKEVRTEFSDSRIFFGKTKVMAKALGTDPSTSYLPNLSLLSAHLTGSVGLLFTSRPPTSILSHFTTYTAVDFARAGTPTPRTFAIPAGTVYSRGGEIPEEEDVPLAAQMETTLRKWGMPTRLVKGKVVLDGEYEVCREGQVLDSAQTALLKCFGVAVAEFRVKIVAFWDRESEEVTVVEEGMETGE